jgi:hypothetical protein
MRAKHWGLRLGIIVPFLTVMLCCGGSDSAGNGGGGGGTGGRGSGGAGGQGGGVVCGTSVCSAGQICCPGCEPGTGTCLMGGCPGSACPPPRDASDDLVTDASGDGSGICQGVTCGPNDVCVHPSCGGGVPICQPVDDAGMCPPGWQHQPNCFQAGYAGPGCAPPPCQPPAPFCAPKPPACGNTVTCNCLPFNICQGEAGFGGQCAFISGTRDVTCLSAAH